ncbi:MAG: PIN domain-containing protein [Spirochaetota bacterium]
MIPTIIVSALLFSGQAAKLHAAWIEGRLSLLFSEAILTEYRQLLGYSRFALTAADVAFLRLGCI